MADEKDLVERLREQWIDWPDDAAPLLHEAADEIERRRHENDEMKFIIESSSWTPEQVAEFIADRVPVPRPPPGPHDCQRCGIGPLTLGPLCPWCAKAHAPVEAS